MLWATRFGNETTDTYKCIEVSYIINLVFLLYPRATCVAIFRQVYYKGWVLQDTTKICEPIHRSRICIFILYFNVCFKPSIVET